MALDQSTTAAALQINALKKSYGAVEVLKDVNVSMAPGEFLVLVGPSGCGKSTLLNCIAGLEEITSGELRIGGRDVTNEPPKDRDIAMVFQSYALYPTMTVAENIGFGMKIRKVPADKAKAKIDEVAKLLQIDHLLDRQPSQLSGGQRQRVAMGRAIVRNPKVFLFDEPLSNLDAKLRVQMRTEIKRVHQKVPVTTVYVTHDQVEAMTLADRVVVMNNGIIEQVGAPNELYHHPATRFVAGFIGSPAMNFIPCTLEQAGSGLLVRLSSELALPIPDDRAGAYRDHVGKKLEFGIRPEHLTEVRHPREGEAMAPMSATLDVVEPMGMETLAYFTVNGAEVCARMDPSANPQAGQKTALSANMSHMHLLDPQSNRVLGNA
jgi:multiple sugar transport system ATP-binding protein